MPIYEYECGDCGHEMEALQKMSDAALVDCPECGKPALSKKISAAAFRLKGGGWYETDFKTGNKKNLAGDAAKNSGQKTETAKSSGDSGGNTASASKSSTTSSSSAS